MDNEINNQNSYDIAVCGMGLSGLLLLYFLNKYQPQLKIIGIDLYPETISKKTFSFWHPRDQTHDFDDIVAKSWDEIAYKSSHFTRQQKIRNYEYQSIYGVDLESFVKKTLIQNTNIQIVNEKVVEINNVNGHASIKTSENTYLSRIAFNSILDTNSVYAKAIESHKYHFHTQHFLGWRISTTNNSFDSNCVKLFDFNEDTESNWNFFYTLPYSANTALIENVSLSPIPTNSIKNYLKTKLKIKDYSVEYIEKGSTPMTDFNFSPQKTSPIINIGLAGGMLKPSTGYLFTRALLLIEKIAQMICSDQKQGDFNFNEIAVYLSKTNMFYKKCDSLFLHIMERYPDKIQYVFDCMFKHNTADEIFRFLDEKSSLLQKGKFGIGLLPVIIYLRNRLLKQR